MSDEELMEKIKRWWSTPRDIEVSEWYILLAIFGTLWMWMFIL